MSYYGLYSISDRRHTSVFDGYGSVQGAVEGVVAQCEGAAAHPFRHRVAVGGGPVRYRRACEMERHSYAGRGRFGIVDDSVPVA